MDGSAFLAAVQRAALPGTWSKGVELARAGAVVRVAGSSTELEARVRAPGVPVPPTVTLYLEDEEWSCDCPSKVDPCLHVAAAAIAFARGQLAGGAAPADVAPGAPASDGAGAASKAPEPLRVRYLLGTQREQLVVRRVLARGAHEEPLGGTLADRVVRGDGAVLPSHDDMNLDRVFASFPQGVVTPARVAELFRRLEGADVRAGDEVVRVDATPVKPVARVEDAANGGFRLSIVRHPTVASVFARGVVRTKDGALRPLAQGARTGEALERLPLERVFREAELGELATRVLPELELELELEVKTRRLPGRTRRVPPRVAFDAFVVGEKLSVLPTIVYGDPPLGRVDGDTLVALVKGQDLPVRDREAESRLRVRTRDELGLEVGRRVEKVGAEAAALVTNLERFEGRAGARGVDRDVAERPKLVARVRVLDGGAIDVVFEADETGRAGGARHASAEAVLAARRAGMGLVPLVGGGFGELPADWLGKYGDRVADLLAARGEGGALAPAAAVLAGEVLDELALPRPPELARLAPLATGLPEVDLPRDLTASLRDYQREGVRWLSFLRSQGLGGLLADDMGLGKTLQCACVLGGGRALVVVPKSMLWGWQAELARFRPSLRVARYHGPDRALDAAADVTLTTYAVLRLDVDRLVEAGFDAVVFDEAQALKNPDSQAARAARRLAKVPFKLALSGTPVENRVEELWSLAEVTVPGLLGGRASFGDRFEAPMARGDADAARRLRKLMAPFLLRRKKADVLPELPPRTEVVRVVPLEDDERKAYDAVLAATRKDVAKLVGDRRGALAILEALLRLRQAACHPALLPGGHAETSSKLEALRELVREATGAGHRVLVFSQWTSVLDLVEPALRDDGVSFDRLDGATRDREGVVTRFQSDDGPSVLLLSLKAGGTGLTLTKADHVVLFDPWWNPAVEDQAADRAHRIGQDRPVLVHRLVARDTVEERMLELVAKKRALAAAALEGEAGPLGITAEDLAALIEP